MGPIDPPRTPETGVPHDDRPVLVTVGRRDGWRPAMVAIVALALVLGAAVWKPWEGARPASAPTPSRLPGGSDGGLLPPITSGPGPTGAFVPTVSPAPAPTRFAGLDLALMGTADPHAAWGVAVAYVSQIQFVNAVARGSPTVTPVVSWELADPETNPPGSILDHPGVTSIAVAATWPVGIRIEGIRLIFVGSAGSVPSKAVEVDLGVALAARVELVDGSVGPAAPPTPGVGLPSGAFYLTASDLPTEPAAWTSNGWPVGVYRFQVTQDDGVVRSLPFEIGGPSGP